MDTILPPDPDRPSAQVSTKPRELHRITFLLGVGTIDEVVNARVETKAQALGQMLDDPDLVTMALPEDEDYGPAIESEEDLAALFAHLRGVTDE